MTIRAAVFDIGGVLEYTPKLGVETKWEQILGLNARELNRRLYEVWKDGSLGHCTEADVHRRIQELIGMTDQQLDTFMADIWMQYLGELNVELNDYFIGLRSNYQTAILSNSFVGAREKEQAAYGFEDHTDLIIYSHEVGIAKPDPDIYQMTCDRLGLQPEQIVFLDDVPINIEAAQKLGMKGVLFNNNAQAISEINAYLNQQYDE